MADDSLRPRRQHAVAAFGVHAEQALKLRQLGDMLDDLVQAVGARDPLAEGTARKLLLDLRALAEPLLFFPLEIRAAGRLLLAAESTRARFVLPAFQAGLRVIALKPETTIESLLALARGFSHLERGTLASRDFFDWLWNGNPEGLANLLGHPAHEAASTLIDSADPPDVVWSAHTASAMKDWNDLALEAGQSLDVATLAARYRAPLERLTHKLANKELLLKKGELEGMRDALEASAPEAEATQWLLSSQPALAGWLAPTQAATVVHTWIERGLSAPELFTCIDRMSPSAARSALAAAPELMLADAARFHAYVFEDAGSGYSPYVRALLINGAQGARRLCDQLITADERVPDAALRALFGALLSSGLSELVHALWCRAHSITVRIVALQALSSDLALLDAALTARPVTAADPPLLQTLAQRLRSGGS